MLIAWWILAPAGILLGRYFKSMWPTKTMLGTKVWFQVNLGLQKIFLCEFPLTVEFADAQESSCFLSCFASGGVYSDFYTSWRFQVLQSCLWVRGTSYSMFSRSWQTRPYAHIFKPTHKSTFLGLPFIFAHSIGGCLYSSCLDTTNSCMDKTIKGWKHVQILSLVSLAAWKCFMAPGR